MERSPHKELKKGLPKAPKYLQQKACQSAAGSRFFTCTGRKFFL